MTSERAALEDAALWLEAEADHPRPDPRPAMRLQAGILRAALAATPAPREDGWEEGVVADLLGVESALTEATKRVQQAIALAAGAARLAAARGEPPEPAGTCWFCKGRFVIDALIAGYDTFEESRLACLACNERMSGDWKPAP